MGFKKVFCTFADSRMSKSLRRIERQAKAMGYYDLISINDENALDADFREKLTNRLVLGSRGYGYWAWKPQIILQTLKNMDEGDVLQYTDAGCHLNPRGYGRLNEYFELVKKSSSGILAFQGQFPEDTPHLRRYFLPEKKWTKGDLFEYFKITDERIRESSQIGAGIIFFRKCSQAVSLVEAWRQVYFDDFRLADDSPSRVRNDDSFSGHRHDQSILSLLCKINRVETVSAFEYWYPAKKNPAKPDWSKLKEMPILAKRDKDYGLFKNIEALSSNILKKIATPFRSHGVQGRRS